MACKKELSILDEISRFSLPHIVSYLAAWEQSNSLFILLPFADCSLRQFLTKSAPELTPKVVLWFIRQLRGLANGVRHLHNLSRIMPSSTSSLSHSNNKDVLVIHLDLRPENILVFNQSPDDHDVFMISDFGSGEINSQEAENSNILDTMIVSADTTLTYAGPDLFLDGRVFRPFDMWALGCVYLELTSWLCLGPDRGVNDFANARLQARYDQNWQDDAFWQSHDDTDCRSSERRASLRPAVVQRLNDLESRCVGVLSLVLSSMRKLLIIKSAERIDAQTLFSELETIYLQAQLDPNTY